MIQLYDIKLEKIALGQVLLEPRIFDVIGDLFFSELFYDHKNVVISETILSLKNQNKEIDIATVSAELRKNGKINNELTVFYVSDLIAPVASTANIEVHLRYLQELYMKRKIISSCEQTIKETYEAGRDVFEIVDGYEKRLTAITSKILTTEPKKSNDVYAEMMKRNDMILNREGFSGIPSGFSGIDRVIQGWQNGDMIVLAARPGMGKTALALEFLKNPAVMLGVPTAILSLEMPTQQLYSRLMAQCSGIEGGTILKTGLNHLEIKVMNETCNGLVSAPIYFDDEGGLTVFQIKNKARKLKRDKGIKLLIIDYMQLINAGIKTNNREAEISYTSRSLKALAKELNIPVIVLSQLSREVEKRPGKIPELSDLRDSGSIEQDADIVTFIYRPEYYSIMQDENNNSTAGKAMIMIKKHRNGSLDDIQLNFNGSLTHFTD